MMHIRSERDAADFLLKCLQDPEYGNDGPVDFKGLALRIRLDPGNGRADWKAMRAVRLLQHHLNLTYLLAKSGRITGRLSEFERELLSVNLTVSPGSTNLAVECEKAFKAIRDALPAHFSMRARNLIAVGSALGTLAGWCIHEYGAYRAPVDVAHIAAAASLEATDRTNRANLEIANLHANAQVAVAKISRGDDLVEVKSPSFFGMQGAVVLAQLARDDSSNVVGFAVSDYVPWRSAFLDLAPLGGTVQWNDTQPIQANKARAIAKSAKKQAAEQRRIAKAKGQPGLIETPWVTEVLEKYGPPEAETSWGANSRPLHSAPGAMRLGLTDA